MTATARNVKAVVVAAVAAANHASALFAIGKQRELIGKIFFYEYI